MQRILRPAAVASLALILAGCDEWGDWGDSNRFKEDFQYSYTLKPGARIDIENSNGAIDIVGWERDTVEIAGTKYASNEQIMKAMKIDISQSPDTLRIRTVPPSGHRGNWGARYTLRVPHRVNLDRIASSNGSIRIEALEGGARLRTSNGGVKVIRIKGAVEAETSNGSIEVSEHGGSLVARTSNGAVRADNVRGHFEASTSNGSINARLADPEPGKSIRLSSSNGSVTLEMAQIRDNEVHIDTSNSSITLRLPPSARALLKARTSHSNITTDFDVRVRAGEMSKGSLEGELNGGGPLMHLTTSNGSIRVLKL